MEEPDSCYAPSPSLGGVRGEDGNCWSSYLWRCSHLQPGGQGAPGGGMRQLWGSLCIPKLSSLNIQGRERAPGAPQAKSSLNEQLAWALIPSQMQLTQAQAKNKLYSPKPVSLPLLEGCLFPFVCEGIQAVIWYL